MNNTYTVDNYASIYTSKKGKVGCHRNYIYKLIADGNLPKGAKLLVIDGKKFIQVKK